MANLLILPIVIPFLSAALALLWRRRAAQRAPALLGAAGLLGVGVSLVVVVAQGGPLVLELGNWPAPFAIVFVADLLSASMLFLVAVGLLYAEAGTLNLADLARVVPRSANPGLMTAIATLFSER